MEEVINKIYQEIKNKEYKIKSFKGKCKESEVEKYNTKELLEYYIIYNWYNIIKSEYYKSLIDFVVVPKTKIKIKTLDEFIEIIHYIKYKY